MIESIPQKKENFLLVFLSFIRYPLAFFLSVFFTLFCSIVLIIFSRPRSFNNWLMRNWGRWSCFFFGIKVECRGLENIPKEGCLFLFNHASLYDIPIMYGWLKKDFRFGAKAELFKVPFFGGALRATGMLPIHRAKRGEVLKLYQESVERIDRGESFALAPEGTRQLQAAIGEFKRGPFIFAVQAQAPLVPVVLSGTLEIIDKDGWLINRGRWNRKVCLEVLPPVSTKGCDQEQITQLQEVVREAMIKAHRSPQ